MRTYLVLSCRHNYLSICIYHLILALSASYVYNPTFFVCIVPLSAMLCINFPILLQRMSPSLTRQSEWVPTRLFFVQERHRRVHNLSDLVSQSVQARCQKKAYKRHEAFPNSWVHLYPQGNYSRFFILFFLVERNVVYLRKSL